MKTEKIEFFKMILLQLLKDLQQRNEETISLISDQEIQSPDILDRASVEVDQDFFLRIKNRESKLTQKILNALARIENGSFGICETCGEDISIKRLKARPVAMQCIDCKTRSEIIEKASGL